MTAIKQIEINRVPRRIHSYWLIKKISQEYNSRVNVKSIKIKNP